MYFHSLRLLVLIRVDMKIIPQDVVIPSEAPCFLCIQQTGFKCHPLKIVGETWTLAMPHISISGPTQVVASLYNSLASTASPHALDIDLGRLLLVSNHCRKGFCLRYPASFTIQCNLGLTLFLIILTYTVRWARGGASLKKFFFKSIYSVQRWILDYLLS